MGLVCLGALVALAGGGTLVALHEFDGGRLAATLRGGDEGTLEILDRLGWVALFSGLVVGVVGLALTVRTPAPSGASTWALSVGICLFALFLHGIMQVVAEGQNAAADRSVGRGLAAIGRAEGTGGGTGGGVAVRVRTWSDGDLALLRRSTAGVAALLGLCWALLVHRLGAYFQRGGLSAAAKGFVAVYAVAAMATLGLAWLGDLLPIEDVRPRDVPLPLAVAYGSCAVLGLWGAGLALAARGAIGRAMKENV
jgi:hypothetical protein